MLEQKVFRVVSSKAPAAGHHIAVLHYDYIFLIRGLQVPGSDVSILLHSPTRGKVNLGGEDARMQ